MSNDLPRFSSKDVTVVFVLGGPGAGKGTQCTMLASHYGFVHLSAGDLLRAERLRPGSECGELINTYIKEGRIVPMHITIGLLKQAMEESGKTRFLVDGFPRDVPQGIEFERVVCESTAMLFYDCSEDVLINRILGRGQTSGRVDDNIESVRLRLETYYSQTMPVKEWARKAGKLVEVDCHATVDEVFKATTLALDKILK